MLQNSKTQKKSEELRAKRFFIFENVAGLINASKRVASTIPFHFLQSSTPNPSLTSFSYSFL